MAETRRAELATSVKKSCDSVAYDSGAAGVCVAWNCGASDESEGRIRGAD